MIRKDRIQRLQENMAKEGMDAYLILTHDDYYYFLTQAAHWMEKALDILRPGIQEVQVAWEIGEKGAQALTGFPKELEV